MVTATKPRISLNGLKPLLKLDELDRDDGPPAPPREEPPRMALDLIDDSPTQPRKEYDPVTLQELADSITAAGDVLQPVSLRPNPDVPGRYYLNFGHRRVRAARMAGLTDVPYFIGQQCDSFAQVIENEQRDSLRPLDLAAFIRDRMAEGFTQQDIARRLGKSKTAVSTAAALADAPLVVVEALRSGKVDGVSPAYELVKLHAAHPGAVQQFIGTQGEISRAAIGELRQQLEASLAVNDSAPAGDPLAGKGDAAAAPSMPAKAPSAGQAAKPALPRKVLMAEYKGQPLVLDLDRVPEGQGQLHGCRPGSTRRLTVPAAEVKLVGFVQG